jgi:hypothetical protein
LWLAEAQGPLPTGHVVDRLEGISRQLPFACDFLKLLKILSESMNLPPTLIHWLFFFTSDGTHDLLNRFEMTISKPFSALT